MGPSKLRRAIGAVKDRTSIGLAKVNASTSLSDLEVAIVKATSHEEYPPEERHVREILSLTCYSRQYVGACVNMLARRLNKTKNWVVALKVLMVIQRLLVDGDRAYEQEIFFATRLGTRLLNLSDFRDTSRSNSWDYSAFVRTYGLYLDEKLEYRMQGRRRRSRLCAYSYDEAEEEEAAAEEAKAEGEGEEGIRCSSSSCSSSRALSIQVKKTPAREMKVMQLIVKIHQLHQLLERFLATRPAGAAKLNRVVIVALYPAVKESFQIYYEITDILTIFIDKFMELNIPDCVKVYDIFCRSSKQFDELYSYYTWCKDVGVARSSEYPEVERITPKKLDLMDEFIRDKSASLQHRRLIALEQEEEEEEDENDKVEMDNNPNQIKALLPPPEGFTFPEEQDQTNFKTLPVVEEEEEKLVDLLDLSGDDDPFAAEDQGNKLALALFDSGFGSPAPGDDSLPPPPQVPMWEAFKDNNSDWETALVQSASYLPHQRINLGGGLDTMLLDGLYHQGGAANTTTSYASVSGSASSVAYWSVGNPLPPPHHHLYHHHHQMLALPAPPAPAGGDDGNPLPLPTTTMSMSHMDPFAASTVVAPPPYVQMSELERKRRLLLEEQMMWQQYTTNGMQAGHIVYSNYQGNLPPYNMGDGGAAGNTNPYNHGYKY